MSDVKLLKWEPHFDDITKNIDLMEGYESPIQKIVQNVASDIIEKENVCLMEYVHKVDFNVNEKELKRVLQYDRDSYAKGVEYGIKVGREMIAKEFIEIIIKTFNQYGIDFHNVVDRVLGDQ